MWLHSTKKTYQLKKYGYIYHISWRMKYAIMYVDSDQAEETMAQLTRLKNVKRVERSVNQDVNMDFSVALDAEAERIAVERRLKGAE